MFPWSPEMWKVSSIWTGQRVLMNYGLEKLFINLINPVTFSYSFLPNRLSWENYSGIIKFLESIHIWTLSLAVEDAGGFNNSVAEKQVSWRFFFFFFFFFWWLPVFSFYWLLIEENINNRQTNLLFPFNSNFLLGSIRFLRIPSIWWISLMGHCHPLASLSFWSMITMKFIRNQLPCSRDYKDVCIVLLLLSLTGHFPWAEINVFSYVRQFWKLLPELSQRRMNRRRRSMFFHFMYIKHIFHKFELVYQLIAILVARRRFQIYESRL